MARRGLVDMRKRFRGNHPVALMGERQAEGTQLYAGKPAYVEPAASGSDDTGNPAQ